LKESYKYIFGPVPSRRLGKSLGVSPIPQKTCNYSCVYCQIGRTTHFTNIREEFFPKEDILFEIADAVTKLDFDYITFVGEGEPTLNKNLGWLIRETKKVTDKPVAVITNGALLYDPKVREELLAVDVILPTLDATTQNLFKKVNRPKKGLEIDQIIQGFIDFRKVFQGQIWMEVMVVQGLNDTEENITAIKELLDHLQCERVYVNVPIRPPAEKWVKIPTKERIIEICAILDAQNIDSYEEVSGFHIDKTKDLKDQILKITSRHPLRESQILSMANLPEEETLQMLVEMEHEGLIVKKIYNEKVFWLVAKKRKK
jgi:wyosine [tRNA(Phe)-imidazoG37] synthetase (radical SAM superfamily)